MKDYYPLSSGKICIFSLAILILNCIQVLAYTPQKADETTLRKLTEEFFIAYKNKNLNQLMALWSNNSPDYAENKETFEQAFSSVDKIELKSLQIKKIDINTEKAGLRLVLDIYATDVKTGKAAAGFGKMYRTLEWGREKGKWKLWRYVSSTKQLAAALAAANTEEECKVLIATERGLVTPELVQDLNNLARSIANQGNYSRVLNVLKITLSLAEQLGEKKEIGLTLNSLGIVYTLQGNSVKALDYLEQGLKLAEELGDKNNIVRLLTNIGNSYSYQTNHIKALDYYQRNLKMLEELKDEKQIIGTLNNIGNAYFHQNDYTRALDYYQQSLKKAEDLDDKEGKFTSIGNISLIHKVRGDYFQALEYARQSLKMAEEMEDKLGVARQLHNIGIIHRWQGNYLEAHKHFRQSAKLAEELGDQRLIAAIHTNMGSIQLFQGDYTQALRYYQKSLEVSEQLKNSSGVASALNNIGLAHLEQGNYPQALEYLQQSLKLAKELGDKSIVADSLLNIGEIYIRQNNYVQAMEYLEQSLKLSEELGARDTASALLSIGTACYLQGNYTRAQETLQRGINISKQINNLEGLWRAHTTAGKVYRAINKPELAHNAFSQAIDNIEELRSQVAGGEQEQQKSFENKISPYYEMIDLLISQNNSAEAFTLAERAKGRTLIDVLRDGKTDVTKALNKQELKQEKSFNYELVSLNSQLFRERQRQQPDQVRLAELDAQLKKVRLDYESFQANLYAAHPELKLQRGQTPLLTLEQIGKLLPDTKTALVEFTVSEKKLYLFLITKKQEQAKAKEPNISVTAHVINIGASNLKERVVAFRNRIAEGNLKFRDQSRELYDLLLKPLEQQLKGKTTLCIIPDGALWELPFQALLSSSGRYVIEDQAIFLAPSLSVLYEMVKKKTGTNVETTGTNTGTINRKKGSIILAAQKERSPASTQLVAFGNPLLNTETVDIVKSVYRDEKLGPLPEAEREVKTVAQIHGQNRSLVFTGAQATETNFKKTADQAGILHFATHGLLDDSNPMYSRLMLSRVPEEADEDGMLEAREIINMDLKADMVVLSACQTARGRIGSGEGVIGMSWALFVAGVPSTVVSQWKVDSASTTELMIDFYENLMAQKKQSSKGMTKAEALRQASLKLLQSDKYKHPADWAGFVLIGNGF